jgi:hypothetical protein
MRLLTGGLVALALLSGCASATVRDTCRQRIDDCIRACPASLQARPQAHGGHRAAGHAHRVRVPLPPALLSVTPAGRNP